MINIMMRLFGERALHRVVSHDPTRNPLDLKFGVSLVRDRRVPFKSKLLAFGLGVGLLALLMALEIPVEAIATFLAPVLLPLDFMIDGLEIVALPLLFMALIVAHVAPRALIERLRAERLAAQYGPVIDIQPVETFATPQKPLSMSAASTPQNAGPSGPQVVGMQRF